MAEVKAADLPAGSIVADRRNACIKRGPDNWMSTDGNRPGDAYIETALDLGATVVRRGYGQD